MNSLTNRMRMTLGPWVLLISAVSFHACDSKTDVQERTNSSADGSTQSKGVPLSLEDTARYEEIAKILGLNDSERTILRDLLERDHPAVKPLHKLITEMDARLAPYIKDRWILFSDHIVALQQKEELNSRYIETIASLSESVKQIPYLLGLVDSAGQPMTSIRIASGVSDDPISFGEVLDSSATSFRALAKYGESATERDVTNLVSWKLIPFENGAGSPDGTGFFTQNSTSGHIISLKQVEGNQTVTPEGEKLEIALGDVSTQISLKVVPAMSTTYSVKLTNISTGEFSDNFTLPQGRVGLVQLIATVTSHTGTKLDFDVSGEATWKILSGNGKMLAQENDTTASSFLRSGLTVGLSQGGLDLQAKIKGRAVTTTKITITPPDHLAYFFPGWGVDYDSPEVMGNLTAMASSVVCSDPDLYVYDILVPQFYGYHRTMTHVGSVINPGLHEVKSDCSVTDVSANYNFLVDGERNIIGRTVGDNGTATFTAESATSQLGTVSVVKLSGDAVQTMNSFTVDFQPKTLVSGGITSAGYYYGAYEAPSQGEYPDSQPVNPFQFYSNPAPYFYDCNLWTENRYVKYNDSVLNPPEPYVDSVTSDKDIEFEIWLNWNDCAVEYVRPDENGNMPYGASVSITSDDNIDPSDLSRFVSFGTGSDALKLSLKSDVNTANVSGPVTVTISANVIVPVEVVPGEGENSSGDTQVTYQINGTITPPDAPSVPLRVIYQAGDMIDTISYSGNFVFTVQRDGAAGTSTELLNTPTFGTGSTSASKTNDIPNLCYCGAKNAFKMTINANGEQDVSAWQRQNIVMLARSYDPLVGALDILYWMKGRLGKDFNFGEHTILLGGFAHEWPTGEFPAPGTTWNDNDDFKAIFTCLVDQCPNGGAGTTLEFIGTSINN